MGRGVADSVARAVEERERRLRGGRGADTAAAARALAEQAQRQSNLAAYQREQTLERQFAERRMADWASTSTGGAASIGMGLRCNDCTTASGRDGTVEWTFRSFPVIGGVQPGSVAERLGLRTGDTLRTIDDISLTTAEGASRLGSIAPGKTIKLGWQRSGVAASATITLPRTEGTPAGTPRLTQNVGNSTIQVFGRGASWTRDAVTGALRITGDSIIVIVNPVRAARDTVRSRRP